MARQLLKCFVSYSGDLSRSVRSRALILAALLLPMAGFAPAATAERRVALLIGNSAYEHNTRLSTATTDAKDLAYRLEGLGFAVTLGLDVDQQNFDTVFRSFLSRARDADVALFFFSGHGKQVDGRSYLAPIDSRVGGDTVPGLGADEMIGELGRAARATIVLLDACRDAPLRSMPNVGTAGENTLISYSTWQPNAKGDSGGAGRNSPFTTALLKHLDRPGLAVTEMMTDVTADVIQSTNGLQKPEVHSRLTTQIRLRPFRSDVMAAAMVGIGWDRTSKPLVARRIKIADWLLTCEPYFSGIALWNRCAVSRKTVSPGDSSTWSSFVFYSHPAKADGATLTLRVFTPLHGDGSSSVWTLVAPLRIDGKRVVAVNLTCKIELQQCGGEVPVTAVLRKSIEAAAEISIGITTSPTMQLEVAAPTAGLASSLAELDTSTRLVETIDVSGTDAFVYFNYALDASSKMPITAKSDMKYWKYGLTVPDTLSPTVYGTKRLH